MQKKLTFILAAVFLLSGIFPSLSRAQSKANSLTVKQQAIIPIASFGALGELDKLTVALNEALDSGMTVNEIKEVLVQLYAYAGFPRSLNAINTFMAVTAERAKKGIKDTVGPEGKALKEGTDKFEYGQKVQTELIGAPNKAAYQDFTPAIDSFLKEHLFADIFGRGILTYQEREIATVSILSTIPGVNSQLKGHLNISMNTGLTETQIMAVIDIIDSKVGKNVADNVRNEYKTVLKNRKK